MRSYPNLRLGTSLRSRAWLIFLFIFLCTFPFPLVAQQQNEKRVLMLFSEYAQRREFLQPFESSLQAKVKADITFDEAYLEAPYRMDEKHYMEGFAENLYRRFAGAKLDLVVAVSPPAVSFVLQYREKIFPGVPVVFLAVSSMQFGGRIWPGVTGVTNHIGLGETIDLALRLQPDTEAMAVISPYDPPWLAATHKELNRYRGKVREIDIIGPPSRQVLEKVVALPPHTVVLFDLALQDSGQPPLAGFDLLDAVAQRFPTYSAWPGICLNHGCIGGAFEEAPKVQRATAEIAARILSGEPVDKIPVADIPSLQVRVDWRALQRWHIPESALPPGSQVLYREPTLWERYGGYVVAALGIIVAQAILILALFWQRSRRRKTELALRQSEEKFSRSFRHSPLAITITRMIDSRYVEVNDTFEEQTGWKRQEVLGRTPMDIRLWENPDERVSMEEQLQATGRVRDLEFRVRRKDGQIFTALGSAELIEVDGEPCALSVAADITARKLAEEALAGVGRKLIEAQEAERSRIARELHDDINQRVALLAVNLHMLRQKLPLTDIKTGMAIEEAYEQVANLGSEIQALSHRLHSSGLEYIGLERAVTGFCQELSEQQNLDIQLHTENVPGTLSHEISLCLFRVLQEAIQNALKYSGVREFEVSLTGTSNEIQLMVHDSGAGFDPNNTSNGHGLGLTSMRERLRLVKGHLSIESQPLQGTTITARVPVVTEATLDPKTASANSAA